LGGDVAIDFVGRNHAPARTDLHAGQQTTRYQAAQRADRDPQALGGFGFGEKGHARFGVIETLAPI
jgi:hypothetical protein